MPKKDQTGPLGKGPLTGGGMGVCQGLQPPRFTKTGVSCGMGFGQRRGYHHKFCLTGLMSGCAFLTYCLFNNRKKRNK